MLDHMSIPVNDVEKSAAFYMQVLEPLGLKQTRTRPQAVGFGPKDRAPIFWLLRTDSTDRASSGVGLHISFRAPDRESVDRFHETGIACGGRDAGKPGIRPQYTAPFYGAFLLDVDGYKIEAVCRSSE